MRLHLHFPELHSVNPATDWNNKINHPILSIRKTYRENFLRNKQISDYKFIKQDSRITNENLLHKSMILRFDSKTKLPDFSFPPSARSFKIRELQTLINLEISFETRNS